MDNGKPSTRKPGRSRPDEYSAEAEVHILPGIIHGRVYDAGGAHVPIQKARVFVFPGTTPPQAYGTESPIETDQNGEFDASVDAGPHVVVVDAFGKRVEYRVPELGSACRAEISIPFDIGLQLVVSVTAEDREPRPCGNVTAGTVVTLEAIHTLTDREMQTRPWVYDFISNFGSFLETPRDRAMPVAHLDTTGAAGHLHVTVRMRELGSALMETSADATITNPVPQPITGAISVGLRRTASTITNDLPLWLIIRTSTDAIAFRNYQKFMDVVLCGVDPRTE